ncbi:MAG: SDR family NAD(P)-dependent oxidoreductase, partial [Polaromonas sp.]|nr:SDR family NAD(P)-dependent oxidoreductase [Polaromonas sp.]
PVLGADEDVSTNPIHADELTRACCAALWRGKPQRVTNVNDDSQMLMGDYFDMAADLYGLSRPPRLTYVDAAAQLPAMQMSFMGESRRLMNRRLKHELRLVLRYPTAAEGLR